MFKVIIAGGRDFKDEILLKEKCDKLLTSFGNNVEVVSGGQITIDKETKQKYGADYLGEKYAKFNDFKVTKFPADWKTQGKTAGPKRNKQMAEYADALIAFWDGKSRGTKNMIDEATKLGLKVRVVRY